MAQRILFAIVAILVVAILAGGRMRANALKGALPPTGQAPTAGAAPRTITLQPNAGVGEPSRGTPGIDLLATLAVRRQIAREGTRVYLNAMFAETDSMVVRWADRPSHTYTVMFFPDSTLAGWSPDALTDARAGMQRWSGNSSGVSFAETTDTATADIAVRWISASGNPHEAGNTSLSWDREGKITRATMLLGLRFTDSTGLTSSERQRTAAHEFGHALGLPHSPEPEDLMFAKTELDSPSRRDQATLLLLYAVPPGPLKVP